MAFLTNGVYAGVDVEVEVGVVGVDKTVGVGISICGS
jgi:hypothetical protein